MTRNVPVVLLRLGIVIDGAVMHTSISHGLAPIPGASLVYNRRLLHLSLPFSSTRSRLRRAQLVIPKSVVVLFLICAGNVVDVADDNLSVGSLGRTVVSVDFLESKCGPAGREGDCRLLPCVALPKVSHLERHGQLTRPTVVLPPPAARFACHYQVCLPGQL